MRAALISAGSRPESPAGAVPPCDSRGCPIPEPPERRPACDCPGPVETGPGQWQKSQQMPQMAPKPTLRAVCSPIST